jgi:signal transduction histidine kinase
VYADATQLGQVFQNLIENALKYRGADPPRVEIGATISGDMCEFDVRDNGIGFQPDQAERIFQMFQRLHRSDDNRGSGIGLAITKRIVQRHGGRIWATSTPGEGSSFRFTLPLAKDASPSDALSS